MAKNMAFSEASPADLKNTPALLKISGSTASGMACFSFSYRRQPCVVRGKRQASLRWHDNAVAGLPLRANGRPALIRSDIS